MPASPAPAIPRGGTWTRAGSARPPAKRAEGAPSTPSAGLRRSIHREAGAREAWRALLHGIALLPQARAGDTRADVAAKLPARQSTVGVGAPAAAVARVGAHWAAAPLAGRRRIRPTRLGRRLRSMGWLR